MAREKGPKRQVPAPVTTLGMATDKSERRGVPMPRLKGRFVICSGYI